MNISSPSTSASAFTGIVTVFSPISPAFQLSVTGYFVLPRFRSAAEAVLYVRYTFTLDALLSLPPTTRTTTFEPSSTSTSGSMNSAPPP